MKSHTISPAISKLLEAANAQEGFEETNDTAREGPSPFSPPKRNDLGGDSRSAPPVSDYAPKTVQEAQGTYDPVNQPRHYNVHPSGVECIEVTEWMNFNLGNVVKYIWRADEKGATIEDLRKAHWYLGREISRLERLRAGK